MPWNVRPSTIDPFPGGTPEEWATEWFTPITAAGLTKITDNIARLEDGPAGTLQTTNLASASAAGSVVRGVINSSLQITIGWAKSVIVAKIAGSFSITTGYEMTLEVRAYRYGFGEYEYITLTKLDGQGVGGGSGNLWYVNSLQQVRLATWLTNPTPDNIWFDLVWTVPAGATANARNVEFQIFIP